jgi:nucleoside-diphosphate-sugar epimerase
MRVLVLGAYGLIGSAIADRLLAAGFKVAGLGRSIEAARRARPEIDWRSADVSTLLRPEDWAPYLRDVDAVVNAVGALQDGGRDDVAAVQRDAMIALYTAAESAGVTGFVQISAVGARADAEPRPRRCGLGRAVAAGLPNAVPAVVRERRSGLLLRRDDPVADDRSPCDPVDRRLTRESSGRGSLR